ncbi:ArsA family ATPase [Streptomyces sp.]|uniref:ArsA family ATPase n=1 Tax=Streptomyces sp. TaxID=1931 RepID=UPI002F42465C
MSSPRTLLITGAAGAGRTSLAASTAAASARSGAQTLLLTADTEAAQWLLPPARRTKGRSSRGHGHGATTGRTPAHEAPRSLGGGAGAEPGADGLPQPYAVDGIPGLHVALIDPGTSFRAGALDLQGRVGSLLGLLGAAPLDPEELTELPGAGALALLRTLREAHPRHGAADEDGPGGPRDPGWDLVVVDLPPARDAIALLALPEQLRRYLGRLLPADRQAARALRPVLAQLAGVPMPAEWAYEAASRADRELASVQAVIEDPATAVAVVVEPGPYAEGALRTARTGLALYGHRFAAVVANRLLPTGSADPFLAGLSGQQQDHLKALAEQCAADDVPLYELPHLGGAPRGPQDLQRLTPAGAVTGGAGEAFEHGAPRAGAAGAARPPTEPWSVEDRLAKDGHFVWSLPLPGAARETLDLVRRGDELVVDAGGFRRIMPLPSALRRCTVAGAALRSGVLRVRFAPDPELWPR